MIENIMQVLGYLEWIRQHAVLIPSLNKKIKIFNSIKCAYNNIRKNIKIAKTDLTRVRGGEYLTF